MKLISKDVHVSTLVIASENVRQTSGSEQAMAELKSSIAAKGLIQPLIGYPSGKKFAVVAGGRRTTALQALLAENNLSEDMLHVTVLVCSKKDARQVSLIENVIREGMTSIDIAYAIAELRKQKLDDSDIAVALGQKIGTVRAFSGYPNLHQGIRDQVEAGDFSFEAALRLVEVENDRALQIMESALRCYKADQIKTVRRLLQSSSIDLNDRRVKYVGLDNYEAAGGKVQKTLLDDDIEILDEELLEKLFAEKLADISALSELTGQSVHNADIEADRPSFVEVPDGYYRVHDADYIPQQSQSEAAELADRLELIRQKQGLDDLEDDVIDSLDKEEDALLSQIRSLKVYGIDPESHADIQQTAYVDIDGKVKTVSFAKHRVSKASEPLDNDENISWGTDTPIAANISKPGSDKAFSMALQMDLSRLKQTIARNHIAADPGRAFDMMTFSMIAKINFGKDFYNNPQPVNLSFTNNETLASNPAADKMAEENPMQTWYETTASIPLGWVVLNEDGKINFLASYRAFEDLDDTTKQTLFAFGVAANLHSGDEHLMSYLCRDIDYAAVYRPSAGLLKRTSIPYMLAELDTICGDTAVKNAKGLKKGDLAEHCETMFSGKPIPGVEADVSAAARNWMPQGVRYPQLVSDCDDEPTDSTEEVASWLDTTETDEEVTPIAAE